MSVIPPSISSTERAQNHYNSDNAQHLYSIAIGRDTLNLGIYEDKTLSVAEGMQKTVDWMAEFMPQLDKEGHVIDLGSGYGHASRYIAKRYGCQVTCLNISEEQNKRNDQLNKESGLNSLIKIVPGDFTATPFEDNCFDAAWSQDAFFHTHAYGKVLEEAWRILKPGGEFVFMDILQAEDCEKGALQEALARVNIHHDYLASFELYEDKAKALGFECVNIIDKSEHLLIHYSKLHDAVVANYEELSKKCTPSFLELSKNGLQQWVKAAEDGLFKWGLFHLKRP